MKKWTRNILVLLLFIVGGGLVYSNYGLFESIYIVNVSKLSSSQTSNVIQLDWTVTRQVLSPDGVAKNMTLVNGMFPGPLIQGNVGDTVVVNVHNQLDNGESTSVHWHGLKQRGNNAMDGADGITQCGIPPGKNFTYSFKLDESGTFWWHSHSHHQRMEGMLGGLIVHDDGSEHYSKAKGSYDEEVVVILNDQYFRSGKQVMDWYLSPLSNGMEPVPDNGYINGRNVFNCSSLINDDDRNACKPHTGNHAQFKFRRNRKYRLRIINAASMANFQFSIDEHELQVIEADSTEVVRQDVHYLPIASGQRYSVIIDGNSTKKKSVFMRAEMNEECFNYPNLNLDPEVKAIISYSGYMDDIRDLVKKVAGAGAAADQNSTPTSNRWSDTLPDNLCMDLDDSLLTPINPIRAPEADQRVILFSKIMKLARQNIKPYAFFNRTSWIPAVGAPNLLVELGHINASDTPPIETITGHDLTPKWGGDQMVVEVKRDKVVELVINNIDESPHPFHLHGHDFYVVRVYEPQTRFGQWSQEYEHEYRLDNPVRRDTVTVPRFGHVVIRFKADNPGIWAFHCHIHWHMMSGMVMQFAEAQHDIKEQIPQPMLEYCEIERNAHST